MDQEKSKEKGPWSAFMTFFSMGGFLMILAMGAAVAVFMSYLTNQFLKRRVFQI
jgi:hypothetical protein